MKQIDIQHKAKSLLAIEDERLLKVADVVQGRVALPADNSVLEQFQEYETEVDMLSVTQKAKEVDATIRLFAIASALSNMQTLYIDSLSTLAQCLALNHSGQHSVLKPIALRGENGLPSVQEHQFFAYERALTRRCFRLAVWLMKGLEASKIVGVSIDQLARAAAAYELNRADEVASKDLRVSCSLILNQLEFDRPLQLVGNDFKRWTPPSSMSLAAAHNFFIAEMDAVFKKNKNSWFKADQIPLREKFSRDQRLDWINSMIKSGYMEHNNGSGAARRYRIR